jgi:hypothetical protein
MFFRSNFDENLPANTNVGSGWMAFQLLSSGEIKSCTHVTS